MTVKQDCRPGRRLLTRNLLTSLANMPDTAREPDPVTSKTKNAWNPGRVAAPLSQLTVTFPLSRARTAGIGDSREPTDGDGVGRSARAAKRVAASAALGRRSGCLSRHAATSAQASSESPSGRVTGWSRCARSSASVDVSGYGRRPVNSSYAVMPREYTSAGGSGLRPAARSGARDARGPRSLVDGGGG